MIFLRYFEENLDALGFEMAPLAWDLAQLNYANESERRAVLNEVIQRGVGNANNAS